MARSQLDIIINLVEKGSKRKLDGLIKGVTALGVALGAVKIAGDVWRAGMEGAALAKAEKAFASMAKTVNQDINQMATAMQKATGGAVDFQAAMAASARAIKLGVADTPEEIEKLTDAATRLGAAMGRTAEEAIGDIVTGIGRMSPLILDNIGIMTNGGKVFEDYAEKIGKTAAELTDAEKKQALFDKTIKDGMALTKAKATQYEILTTAMKDLGDVIKKDLAEALGDAFGPLGEELLFVLEFKRGVDELGWSSKQTAEFIWEYAGSSRDAKQAIIEMADAQRTWFNNIDATVFDPWNLAIQNATVDMGLYEVAALNAGTALEEVTLKALGQKALAALEEAGVGWEGQRQVMEELMGISPQVLDANEKMQAALVEFGDTGNIDLLVARLKDTETLANDLGEDALPVLRSGMEESGAVPDWIQRSWINWVRTLRAAAEASGMDFAQFATGRRQGFPKPPGGGSTFNPGTGRGGVQEPGGAGGANFVVPPGFPADSFPFRASSGERVIIQPASGGQSFFDNSTVNINNGTSMDAFESMLRGLA